MKKRNIKIYISFAILIVALVSISCTSKRAPVESTNDELDIYFASEADGELIAEKVKFDTLECKTNKEKVKLVVNALKDGPKTPNLLAIVTSNNMIKKVTLDDNYVAINLSDEYYDLPVQNQMTLRASFVRTLTNLSFINSVEFFIEDEPLKSLECEVIGPIYKDDIVLKQPDPNPSTKVQNIVLYFGDEHEEKLIAENRKISVSKSIPIERYILEELIKGPTNENHRQTMPVETKINDIEMHDGVCQIDLSSEFKSRHPGGSTSEVLTLYSIVNSLTESSPRVKKVAFLIDGKKQAEFKGYLDFSMLFERDEQIIVQPKK